MGTADKETLDDMRTGLDGRRRRLLLRVAVSVFVVMTPAVVATSWLVDSLTGWREEWSTRLLGVAAVTAALTVAVAASWRRALRLSGPDPVIRDASVTVHRDLRVGQPPDVGFADARNAVVRAGMLPLWVAPDRYSLTAIHGPLFHLGNIGEVISVRVVPDGQGCLISLWSGRCHPGSSPPGLLAPSTGSSPPCSAGDDTLRRVHRLCRRVAARDHGAVVRLVRVGRVHGCAEANMQVRDGMSTEVLTIEPTRTLREAAALMAGRHIGAAVVLAPDRSAICILTERDILDAVGAGADPDAELAGAHATCDLVVASPDWSLEQAAAAMVRGGFRHLVVLSDDQVVGILAMRDIVRCWVRNQVAPPRPAASVP